MPQPTSTYSWQLPIEGDDPWHTGFHGAVGQIDATLAMVQQLGRIRRRVTVVLSAYPTGASTFTSTTSWATVSYAPFGRLRGTFTVVASSQTRIDLTYSMQRVSSRPAFRVILDGSRVQSFAVAADSEWIVDASGGDEYFASGWFTRVLSLGAGTYGATLQLRNSFSSLPSVVGSSDHFVLVARETA